MIHAIILVGKFSSGHSLGSGTRADALRARLSLDDLIPINANLTGQTRHFIKLAKFEFTWMLLLACPMLRLINAPGSPNLQLNSKTFGPSSVIINPA